MPTIVMNATEPALHIKNLAKTKALEIKSKYNVTPSLAVIYVGDDPASKIYVRNKSKACEFIGADFREFYLPSDSSLDTILSLVNNLNNDPLIHGILVQAPIGNLSKQQTLQVFEAVSPLKDVDGFSPSNRARLLTNSKDFYTIPCTPLGIYFLLEFYGISLQNKSVTIIR